MARNSFAPTNCTRAYTESHLRLVKDEEMELLDILTDPALSGAERFARKVVFWQGVRERTIQARR